MIARTEILRGLFRPKLDFTRMKENCTVLNLGITPPAGALNVQEYPPEVVGTRIKEIFQGIYQQLKNGTWPSIEIPLQRRDNIVYDDRDNLFFGGLKQKFALDDDYPDFLHILRAAQVASDMVLKDVHGTKRELFYTDVRLFTDQKKSDRAIENLATLLGTRRKCLNYLASPKGVCIGRLRLRDQNDIIDCESLGSGGWGISPMLDQIEILESDAEFILFVEKDAAVIRLTEERFWRQAPCIIITGKGQPDLTTREFTRRLVAELQIPVLGLADSDPYGLDLLLNCAHGSVQTANETPWLAINDMWWLGVRPSDLDTYHVPAQCRLPMTKQDTQRAEYMLREPRVQNNTAVKLELELMLHASQKTEIQSLSSHGFLFLIEYIMQKLQNGDLVHL